MSAQLVLRLASQVGNAVGNLQLRAVNTVNALIPGSPTVTWLESGVAIADDYTLTILWKSDTAVTVKVETATGPKNPYQSLAGVSAIADSSTVNINIVPSVGIKLSTSCDVGWQAKVTIGDYMDGSGVITPVLGFGIVQAGVSTSGVRICAENIGDAPAQNVSMYSLPGLYFYGTNYATFIANIAPHWDPTRHKLASSGSKVLTFTNWGTDSGSGHKKADVLVGGVSCIVGALFDGATVYGYGAGNGYVDGTDLLQGLSITLALTTSDPTSASITLEVMDGWSWVQYAPDVTGAPGTYANQDLTLTESGQSTETITAGHAAFFWVRWSPPSATSVGNIRKMTQRSRGLTT